MLPIPERIKAMIDLTQRCYDQIGQSDSTVIFFGDKVLKISRESVESWQETRMMQWLSGKIPVPDVLCTEKYRRLDYLLMTRLPGVMACDAYYLARPKELTAILAEGLKMLWSVKDTGCGYNCNLYKKLRMAHHNVRHDRVDLDSRVFAIWERSALSVRSICSTGCWNTGPKRNRCFPTAISACPIFLSRMERSADLWIWAEPGLRISIRISHCATAVCGRTAEISRRSLIRTACLRCWKSSRTGKRSGIISCWMNYSDTLYL